MKIIAIDPGTERSGFVVLVKDDLGDWSIKEHMTAPNYYIYVHTRSLSRALGDGGYICIEKIISHKWSGKETSDAAIWSGVFAGVRLDKVKFITRARVRWELLKKKTGGDKEINQVLKLYNPMFPGLSDSISLKKPDSHQMAAIAVAVASILNPSSLPEMGDV